MAVVIKRVPPPPPIADNDPTFNRWLHDLTAFIGSNGIDTSQIPGYDAMVAMVNAHEILLTTHTSQIAANTSAIATNTTNIATNATNIAANTSAISTHTSQIATLSARSQVFTGITAPAAGLGVNGDWFSDTVAKHIYVKTSGAWVLIV